MNNSNSQAINSKTKGDDLYGQRQNRLDKIQKIKSLGIDPFPAKSQKDISNADIINNYDENAGKSFHLAGRIVSWREHGKVIFMDLLDNSEKIQILIRQDLLKEDVPAGFLGWDKLNLLDNGDFIEAVGEIVKTNTGQISLQANQIKLLTKAIRPLPQTIDEKEQQFRRRYIDLILHNDKKELFIRKAKFWEANREFLKQNGFIEVETPVLEHITGGADANPFITHHNDLDQDFYLRISTELYLKRLVVGGFEKIYTFGPNFRNEGLSDEHLQEYYQIEWYWAYADYRKNMELVKNLFRYVAKSVYGKTNFESRGHKFDLSDEWTEVDYEKVIKERFNVDIFETKDEEIAEILKKEGVDLPGKINRNRLIDNLWKLIRKTISGPAFLINEPKFMSPLAKSRSDNPELTERFHVLIAGSELGNGYSEINDPVDQLDRFLDQQKMRESGDDEAQMMDIDFVEALEYGMPPTSGYGQSERIFWFLENVTAREGTLFPQLKYELENNTLKIYNDILKYISIKSSSNTDKKKQDKTKKFVLVVSKELKSWQLTNTIGHLTAYLGAQVGTDNIVSQPQFITKDEKYTPANSQYPVITLTANPGQLFNLLEKVEADHTLKYLAYTEDMITFSDDLELADSLSNQQKSELKYIGIGIFGDNEKIDKLTKKYSLYK